MSWPTPAEINEAVQNPQLSFHDQELAGGTAEPDPLGIPLARSGSNADVYCFTCGKEKVAVKCFTRPIAHLEHRYEAIHAALSSLNLPFTVDCGYQAQGIWLHDQWYPLVRMQWVDGLRLNEFAQASIGQRKMLNALIQIMAKVGDWLEINRLGHCDLQHGNILLIPSQGGRKLALRLVDYDGMWVPALDNQPPQEFGHPDYQHPTRMSSGYYGPAADRFSLLAIATGLRGVMAHGSELWKRYDNTVNILFSQKDYEDPHRSPLFAELSRSSDDLVRRLSGALGEACRAPLDRVRPLSVVMNGTTTVSPAYEVVGDAVQVLSLMDDDDLPSSRADEYAKLVVPALIDTDNTDNGSQARRRSRGHNQREEPADDWQETEQPESMKKWLFASLPLGVAVLILVILWSSGAFRGKDAGKEAGSRGDDTTKLQKGRDATESKIKFTKATESASGDGESETNRPTSEKEPVSNLPNDVRYAPLFNGTDLSGWKLEGPRRTAVTTTGGLIAARNPATPGSGLVDHLVTARTDYVDFRLRCEFRLDDPRHPARLLTRVDPSTIVSGGMRGYLIEVAGNGGVANVQGSTSLGLESRGRKQYQLSQVTHVGLGASAWHRLEVTVIGKRISAAVNGQVTLDYIDQGITFMRGAIAVMYRPGDSITYRSMEVAEIQSPGNSSNEPSADARTRWVSKGLVGNQSNERWQVFQRGNGTEWIESVTDVSQFSRFTHTEIARTDEYIEIERPNAKGKIIIRLHSSYMESGPNSTNLKRVRDGNW